MSEFNLKEIEPYLDSWQIEKLIGEGSYGYVYKIFREEFGRKYYSALKIIPIPRNESEEKQLYYEGMDENTATEYFKDVVEVIFQEIGIMSELKGRTNIVSFEDHKVVHKKEGAGFYLLIRMELLENIEEYQQHHPFTSKDIVQMGKDLCQALILCQKKNIIHRDIKPANIFVTEDGNFKLGDFGIAKQLSGTGEGLSIKGTYGYMAPEVYFGKNYDTRADIYSLGMVLYYFLNQKRGPFVPVDGTVPKYSQRQAALTKRFQGEKLDSPSQASQELADVVLKACEFDEELRYKTPEEFLEALESLSESATSDLPVITNEAVRESTMTSTTSRTNVGEKSMGRTIPNMEPVVTSVPDIPEELKTAESTIGSRLEEVQMNRNITAEAKTPLKTVVETNAETSNIASNEINPETISESIPETITEIKPETVTRVNLEPVTETKPQTVAGINPETVTGIRTETIAETKPEIKPQTKSEIKPETATTNGSQTHITNMPNFSEDDDFDERTIHLAGISREEEPEVINIPQAAPQMVIEEPEVVQPVKKSKKGKIIAIVSSLVVVAAAAVVAVVVLNNKGGDDSVIAEPTKIVEATPIPTTAPTPTIAPTDTPTPEPTVVPDPKMTDYEVDLNDKKIGNLSAVEDIEKVTKLSAANNKITTLSELENANNLIYLDLHMNMINDINGMSGKEYLEYLNLGGNQIEQLSELSDLDKIKVLDLSDNKISDLTALKNMTEITDLYLGGNAQITDISVLSGLDELGILGLEGTGVTDLSPLYSLTNLTVIDITDTNVSDDMVQTLKEKLPDCEILR